MLSWISGGSFNTNEGSSRQCSLSGYLYKMKRQRKLLVPQWTHRWFSIEGRFFRWYENTYSDEPSGTIDLKKVSYITRFEMQGAHSFIIGYPDRNLMLRAETHEGMEKWIRALQLQADVARGGDGTSIITGGAPSSPASRLRSSKKKSSSMEAELDRNMRQLQDMERLIQGRSADNRIDYQQPSKQQPTIPSSSSRGFTGTSSSSSSSSYGTSSSTNPYHESLSRHPSKQTTSNRQPPPVRDDHDEPSFSYMDAYPHLDDDAPKTGNIFIDTVGTSSTVYKSSSKSGTTTPNEHKQSSASASGKISKSDSHESLEEILDRPVSHRGASKSRLSRPNSSEYKDSKANNINPLAVRTNSSRMPTSQVPSRMNSSRQAIIGSSTSGLTSGSTTEEENSSGRSTNSQGKGYGHAIAKPIKNYEYKSSYDGEKHDDHEIQDVSLQVTRQTSHRSSRSNRQNTEYTAW